jgi:putative ABC transport system permease protein
MSLWRQLVHGVRALANRAAADQDVTDEVRHYLEQEAAEQVAKGLAPNDALRVARLKVGNTTAIREEIRVSGWEHVVETTLADLRHGARRLRASPVFSTGVVLTLALGIGGTTAIFSAVKPVLLDPLPYPGARRIVSIVEINNDGSRNDGTFGMYRVFAERNRSFDAIAVFRSWQPVLTPADQPERLDGQRVSASYFRVLGVAPALGRTFTDQEDRGGGTDLVVLSHALWQRRFAGDAAIIGRPISLDGASYTVVGVMPASFENVLAPAAQLWAPLQYDMSQGRAWGHHLRTLGRLAAGTSPDQATSELSALAASVLDEQRPPTYGDQIGMAVFPLHEEVTRAVRPALRAVLGGVLLLLVIACLNVTNLLLARGTQRRAEFALRTALGAGRRRLTRQLVAESLLLAALAGVLGSFLAFALIGTLVATAPANLPRASAIAVDGAALAFCAGVSALIGLAVGVLPALQASRHAPQQALQGGSRRLAGGNHRLRSTLVSAEVAIALVLLVCSGLLLRSLNRLFGVDVGFSPAAMLTMQVHTAGPGFQSDSATDRFFERALEAVLAVPGVEAAGLTSQLPLSGDRDEYGVRFGTDVQGFSTYRYAVSPGYVEAMKIPLRQGRSLNDRDRADAPRVALISESMARRRFPTEDPIGRTLSIGPNEGYRIVGVVGDVRHASLALEPADAVYVTTAQWPFRDASMSLIARVAGDPLSFAPALRDAVWSVDKDQPVARVATMDALLATSAAERRFALRVFEAFGFAALVLAMAGIFSVVSSSVTERTHEIGLRAALGANRRDIVAMVVRQGLILTCAGIAVGAIGSLATADVIGTLMFGIARLDAMTYIVVILSLTIASVLATLVPAVRAARLDPAQTLRTE